MELSLSLATQIAALFIMIGVGFVLVKMKLCNVKDSRLLSQLTLYVSAPCAIVNSFQIELTADKVKGFLLAIGAAVVIHIIYLTLAEVFSRMFHFNVVEKASVIYSNCGNLILPLVQIVLGQEMVFYASGYMIVQTILLWTHCKTLISEEVNLDFKKIIFNINIIAILIGFILFVGRISLPVMVQSALTSMGNLMGPMSMFVIGMLLSQMNLKKVFGDKRAYLVTFLRLIVLPVVVLVMFVVTGMTRLLPDAKSILMISLLAASGPAASTVTQFAQLFDNHQYQSSIINTLTVLLCIITMPLINMIYMSLV